MGSERKSTEEEKRRRKHRSSDYDSEDEGKSKRHRSVKDEEAKSSKSERKSKTKKPKSHNSSKHHTDKEKTSKEKHKSKRDKHDDQSKLKFQELSTDDYFSKNNEFATWLKEEKSTFFSDLSSESARDLFSQFVKDWNTQKLQSRYYEGIETAPRTAHKWRIKQ